jgi:hypothetical protein
MMVYILQTEISLRVLHFPFCTAKDGEGLTDSNCTHVDCRLQVGGKRKIANVQLDVDCRLQVRYVSTTMHVIHVVLGGNVRRDGPECKLGHACILPYMVRTCHEMATYL